MKILVGAKTDVGRVRQGNEDSYLTNDPVFIVADGMGGHRAGEVASATAIEVLGASDGVKPADLKDAARAAAR